MLPGSKHELKAKAEETGVPHHKQAHQKPETRVDAGGGGTAKRNIVRKGGPAQVRKAGANKHAIEDEESTEEISGALDEGDPNYDSKDDPAVVSNFS